MSLLVSTGPSLSFRSNVYFLRRPTTTTTTNLPLSSASLTPKPPPPLPTPRVHTLHRAPYASPCTPRAAYSAAAVTILRDAGAAAAVLAGAYALVSAFDFLTQRNLIQQSLSRKLVHILSGLFFMASWPIFSTTTEARYFACLVPLVNFLRLVIHGLSLASDEGLIKSVTREGKPEELLRGPLYYVLILILCALIFWRESPVGLISLAMMCGGDGIADIIGRRFGSLKIPYNQQKSWAGSISMFIFGFLISIGMLQCYSVLGYLHLDWVQTVQKVALVSLVATVVESLPTTEIVDDNISVPLVSMAVAFSMFGY
ncbi:probable phytol kinase 1, chloroplastic isoform X2 [Quercus suber]|uniref:probable phytol kinase 1, chloroplastic isoform X2 n=1 Tax=Quercus suber TaxID=58331 RepID=UPI000CE25CC7|nr:probable phytol kinase 1, chloroplastic [Quercus suber]POF07333.1 putative phytol kinase 1, chloroplastic [Quercus suber]